MRSGFIGSAIHTLTEWSRLLTPDERADNLWAMLAQAGMRALSLIPTTLAWMLAHLLYRQSQAAEYRADRLAATVCGKDVMVSALDEIHRGEAFETVLQREAIATEPGSLIATLRNAAKSMPHHEVERRRRIVEVFGSRLDSTHPPTTFRMKFIQKHASEKPALQIPESELVQGSRKSLRSRRRFSVNSSINIVIVSIMGK